MSKRILYRCYESNRLNDILCQYTPGLINNPPQLRYGELPQNKTITYSSGDGMHLISLLNSADYFTGIWATEPYFKGKRKMDKLTDWELRYIPAGKEFGKRMKWEDFKKITKTYEYIPEPNPEKIMFAQLMKSLSADEFIQYCKDKGLNALPVVK